EELPHVAFRQLNKVIPNSITDTARAAVQHEPNAFGFVETNFNKVIPCSERSEIVDVVPSIQRRMLLKNEVVCGFQVLPNACVTNWNVMPRSTITLTAIIRATMRYSPFDRLTNLLQILRQVARV